MAQANCVPSADCAHITGAISTSSTNPSPAVYSELIAMLGWNFCDLAFEVTGAMLNAAEAMAEVMP
jgi:hypothetical protein